MERYFCVKNKQILDEIEHNFHDTSVLEEASTSVHSRFLQSYRPLISVPNTIEALLVRLLKFRQQHNMETCFDVNLDTLHHSEFIELVEIRACFLAFANHMLEVDECKHAVHLFFIHMLAYKHMTFNSDFVPFEVYKQFVMKLLHFMATKGCLFAFCVFCEVCPEFVTDECYPKFLDSLCSNCISIDPLYVEIFLLQGSQWTKYILPQLADNEDTFVLI